MVDQKEYPRIFTPESVRRIRAGDKHRTSRIITRGNSYYDGGSWPKKGFAFFGGGYDKNRWDQAFVDNGPSPAGNPGPYLHLPVEHYDSAGGLCDRTVHRIYPKVWPGDRLWVRELWAPDKNEDGKEIFFYKAEFENPDALPIKWRSPIYMPRRACRLLLLVTGLQIHRIQDIRPLTDIPAEGVSVWEDYPGGQYCGIGELEIRFSTEWNRINAKRGYGYCWNANPWVFGETFEFCTREVR